MADLIDRQKVLSLPRLTHRALSGEIVAEYISVADIEALPSAEPERKTGKWILVKGSNGKDYHKCSKCLHTQEITGVKNYCTVCGADMQEEQDE